MLKATKVADKLLVQCLLLFASSSRPSAITEELQSAWQARICRLVHLLAHAEMHQESCLGQVLCAIVT